MAHDGWGGRVVQGGQQHYRLRLRLLLWLRLQLRMRLAGNDDTRQVDERDLNDREVTNQEGRRLRNNTVTHEPHRRC